MPGMQVSAFGDFAEATGSWFMQSPKDFPVNLAGKHSYSWSKDFKNNGMPIEGGEDIRRSLVFRDNGTYEKYQPGAAHTWVNPQRLDKTVAQFRMTMVHKSWNDAEILLNNKISYGTSDHVFEVFVDMDMEKEMLMWVAFANGVENDRWATPDKTKMEGTGIAAIEPMSLAAFVNEFPNGLFPLYSPGGAWTTIQNIDPTAASVDGQWTPQQTLYTSNVQDNPGNIVAGLDELWMECQWEQPEQMKQYYEDPRLNNQVIETTKTGRKFYMSLCRGGQDRFVAGPQDPSYPDPQFHGVPIKRVDRLETATLYANTSATALTTELLSATAFSAGITVGRGPRFYMRNANYMYPVFHKERFMEKDKRSRHHQVPDTWVIPCATWFNNVCVSRKHQGILSPSGNPYSL